MLGLASRYLTTLLTPGITLASRQFHNVLLNNITLGLRHRNLEIVDIVNHVRRPYECIAKKKNGPVDANDTEVTQGCAVTGVNRADVRGGSEWVDQLGLWDTDSRSGGTAEAKVESGVDFPLRTGDVRESELCGGVHGRLDILDDCRGQVHVRCATIQDHGDVGVWGG